jgi:hypothetical protein
MDTVDPLMRSAHALVNRTAAEAQKIIDEANGLGLNAVEAPYPQRRVRDLLFKAGDPAVDYESKMRLLNEPIVTLTQAFYDDHVRVNAEKRFRAGMAPKIVRRASFKCCDWCASLDGTYDYGDVSNTGNDVFRRHERCRCTVEYVCDGQRQDVWSKKMYAADEDTLSSRDTYHTSTGDTSPETLQMRSEYGLANGRESGIINIDETFSLSSHNFHNSSDSLYERVKHVPPIHGYDDVFIHGDAFGVAIRNSDGTEINVPVEDFIKTLKRLNLENSAIRLCSCSAGEKDRGLAYLVAREMDMPVMAATTDVWVYAPDDHGVSEMRLYGDNGEGQPDYSKPGIWRIFMPDGNIKEVKT